MNSVNSKSIQNSSTQMNRTSRRPSAAAPTKSALFTPPPTQSQHALAKSITKTILTSEGRPPGSLFTKTPSKSPILKKQSSTKKVSLSEPVEIAGLPHPMRLTLPESGPSDRQEYIEYALDMLTHNLIGSGQLSTSEAHLVKTSELRSHISSLVDRVEESHQVGKAMQIASKTSTHVGRPSSATMHRVGTQQWALSPNSLPIRIITNQDPNAKPVGRRPTRPGSATAYESMEKKRTNVLSVPKSIKPKPQPTTSTKQKPKLPISNIQQHYPLRPFSTTRPQSAGQPTATTTGQSSTQQKPVPVTNTSVAVPNKNNPSSSSRPTNGGGSHPSTSTDGKASEESHLRGAALDVGKLMDEASFRFKPSISISSDGGFRAKFDMRGFENEEIYLDLQDRKLTVSGSRPKRDGMNERKTVEMVEIPVGVNLDKLLIARRLDGILQIQESIMEVPSQNNDS